MTRVDAVLNELKEKLVEYMDSTHDDYRPMLNQLMVDVISIQRRERRRRQTGLRRQHGR